MTDPVVPTFSGPELTAGALECVTVVNSEKKVQSYKRQTQIARWSCRQLRILEPYFFEGDDSYAFWKARMSELQTVTHFWGGGKARIMG